MHLLLVDNLLPPYQGRLETLDIHPHLGLISLAAIAQQHGHRASIYDPKRLIRTGQLAYDHTLYGRVARSLLAQRPDALGFTTLGCSFIFALKVAALVKRAEPDLPILLGGPHATMLHREIIEQFDQFDVIVRHEAEQTLPDVLAQLDRRDFAGIPGVTWRAMRGSRATVRSTDGAPIVTDLDTLPIPLYELYPIEQLGLDLMRVEAGRGCPFMCTFCSTASFFQRSYRLKSPERLVHQLDLLHERYGVSEFKLDHDLFTVNQKKVRAFCEAVKGRGYRWRVSARVDCVSAELLETMADAGCIGMYFGIETGSPRMQRIAQKRLDLTLVEPILDAAERVGISATASFITGYPEELQEDQDATLDMVGHCFRRRATACTPQLHMLAPEPGTELYGRFGAQVRYDGYITDYNAWLLDADDEQSIISHPDIFMTYYYYPTLIPRAHTTFAVDACRELRRLGHTILSYALHYYDNRLSQLIAQLRDWAAEHAPDQPVDADLILRFFEHRHHATHHLTSLVRYALRLNQRRAAALASAHNGPSVSVVDHEQRYQLHADACLFSDIHNCGALLRRIREAVARHEPLPLDDRDAGARQCYLVISSRGKDRVAQSYTIDRATHAVLSMFEAPRSLREVSAALAELAGGMQVDQRFFEELIRIGALAPIACAQELAVGGTARPPIAKDYVDA